MSPQVHQPRRDELQPEPDAQVVCQNSDTVSTAIGTIYGTFQRYLRNIDADQAAIQQGALDELGRLAEEMDHRKRYLQFTPIEVGILGGQHAATHLECFCWGIEFKTDDLTETGSFISVRLLLDLKTGKWSHDFQKRGQLLTPEEA